MTRSTQTLLVILIALLAAALVIAIAILFQDEPPPDDRGTKAQPQPGQGGRITQIFDPSVAYAERASGE